MRVPWHVSAVVVACLPALLSAQRGASPDADLEARARAIHGRVLKLDAHVDVLLPSTATPPAKSFADLEKLERGGLNALALAIAVGPGPRTDEGVAQARREAEEKLATIQTWVGDHPDRLQLARSAADVERIHRDGKIAVIESFLNARSLGRDPQGIDRFYGAGVRLFGLTHAGNNDFADSSRPSGEPREEHHGLSPLGKQAVQKLNDLGVIIDVSQLTPAGVQQVLQLSRAPVVASHSGVRALVDHPRNLSDPELDAIKQNGGVVHVMAFNAYLAVQTPEDRTRVRDLRAEFGLPPDFTAASGAAAGADRLGQKQSQFTSRLATLTPRASITDLIDHIDYIVRRIGIDHVGIGTDFNHGAGIEGFADESEAFNVTRELVRRGYTEEQIAKIWGANFLRVFRAVEEKGLASRTR